MWVDQTSISPGPGGSTTFGGIMDAFNVIQSLRYRRKLEAERMAKLMEETARLGGPTTERLLDVPEYSQSLQEQGVQPENIRRFAQSDPELQYMHEREALPPGSTEEDFYNLALRRGAVKPSATSMRQERRLTNTALTEMLKAARTTFDKERNAGATYEQALDMAERQATADPRLTQDQVAEFHERWAPIAAALPRERATAQAPVVAAGIEAKKATATLANTRATDLQKTLQARLEKIKVSTANTRRLLRGGGAGAKPMTEAAKNAALKTIADNKAELAKIEAEIPMSVSPNALRKQKKVLEEENTRLENYVATGKAQAPAATPTAAPTPAATPARPAAPAPTPTPTPAARRRTGANPLGI